MDITRSEAVEADLNRLIEKRHDRRVASEGERLEMEAWRVTELREETRKREEKRSDQVAWCGYLEEMYAKRSEEWGRKKAALMDIQPRGAA